MFPWLRLIRVGFSLVGAARVDLLATTRISLRVWPNDLDVNFHVNNGRYLALADIGRQSCELLSESLRAEERTRASQLPGIGDR